MSRISNIIDELHGQKSTQFGYVSEGYKTIAGVAAKVDANGKIVDEKAKKKIERRIGKKLDEEVSESKFIDDIQKIIDDEDPKDTGSKSAYNRVVKRMKRELGYTDTEAKEKLKSVFSWSINGEVDEGEWKTMKGSHILIGKDGDIIAGGPKSMRSKASKEEIEQEKMDARKKADADAAKKRSEKKTVDAKKSIDSKDDNSSKVDGKNKNPENTKLGPNKYRAYYSDISHGAIKKDGSIDTKGVEKLVDYLDNRPFMAIAELMDDKEFVDMMSSIDDAEGFSEDQREFLNDIGVDW